MGLAEEAYDGKTWTELLESTGSLKEAGLRLFPSVDNTMSYVRFFWVAVRYDTCFDIELYAVPIRTLRNACRGFRGFGHIHFRGSPPKPFHMAN